jgi:hypothetical protein
MPKRGDRAKPCLRGSAPPPGSARGALGPVSRTAIRRPDGGVCPGGARQYHICSCCRYRRRRLRNPRRNQADQAPGNRPARGLTSMLPSARVDRTSPWRHRPSLSLSRVTTPSRSDMWEQFGASALTTCLSKANGTLSRSSPSAHGTTTFIGHTSRGNNDLCTSPPADPCDRRDQAHARPRRDQRVSQGGITSTETTSSELLYEFWHGISM